MRQGRNQAGRWFQEKSGLSLTPQVALEHEQYLREQYFPPSHRKSVTSQTLPPTPPGGSCWLKAILRRRCGQSCEQPTHTAAGRWVHRLVTGIRVERLQHLL